MKVTYVCGFMFSENLEYVVLIHKKHPEWQRDKLNGVGGKIEPGETVGEALVREFEEETGVITNVDDWKPLCVASGEDWEVHFAYTCSDKSVEVKTMTDEVIRSYNVERVLSENYAPEVVFNLRWLIPLCIDKITAKPYRLEIY